MSEEKGQVIKMSDEKNSFGDEVYIRNMALQSEEPKHENNIHDGYIIVDDERIPFQKIEILEGNMSIIMPELYEMMPDEMAEKRYGTEDSPDIIYTFINGDINFALSYKDDLLSEDEDIPGVKDLVQRMVMRSFPGSKVIESEIMEASGRTVAYFDFASEVYNLIFFFSLGETLIMGSFECFLADKKDWKPVFLQMLGSIEEIE